MTASPPRPATDHSRPGGIEHQTLALGPVLEDLRRSPRPRVLDLGAASGANVEFFARYRASLYIADLYRSLLATGGRLPGDQRRLERVLHELLPARGGEPFDLILAWDLINYFERAQLEVLGRRLAPLCRPGGQLYALVATRGRISDSPLSFLIVDRGTLRYEPTTVAERQQPGYLVAHLERVLEAFSVQTSFLLRNGMQEYIFTRRAAPLRAQQG